MKVALYKGKLVRATDCQFKGPFTCPQCGKALILMYGERKRPFFAHKVECPSHCHGETSTHQRGKKQMVKWAQYHGWNPQMEVFLPSIQQRPDVMIQVDSKPFVLEYQCSPLDLFRLIERNQGYRRLRLPYCWFLGPRYHKHLHASKIAQFTQWHQGQPVIPFWDLQSGHPDFRNDYLCVPFVRQIHASKRTKYLRQTMALQQMMMRGTEHEWRITHDLCYHKHHLLSACPLVSHPTEPQWPVLSGGELNWRIRCLLVLDIIPLGTASSVGTWKNLFAKQAHWLPTPCLSVDNTLDLRSRVIDQFIVDLIRAHVLHNNGQSLVYASNPEWFEDGDRKMQYIKTTPLP